MTYTLPYSRGEARAWARENMSGVANVVIPTFTTDLETLNEEAIRHDIRREIECGFWGTLLVSETATTNGEYIDFFRYAQEEAKDSLHLIHHASHNSLEENISVAQRSQEVGASLVLLGYPPTFYPHTEEDLYEYTRTFCDSIDVAVMIFPVPLWGFERIHPSAGFSPNLIERLLDDIPNIVAIKAEGGMPSVGGFVDVFRRFSDRVIVTEPIESNGIPMATLLDMPFMGTSNYEYYGDRIPAIFALARSGKHNEAMDNYWKLSNARKANSQAMGHLAGANFLHRMLWKYQGWLNGWNGGPLRAPTMRLLDGQMNSLRAGLISAGLPVSEGDNAEFFIGRNPK